MPTSKDEILSIASRTTAPAFPALNEEERKILAQIIHLTPPNTNAFNVLLSPYKNTLRRYRIDPKIDDKYYTLLLKLSLVPGIDWKQKWTGVLSINSSPPLNQAAVISAAQACPTMQESRRTYHLISQDKGKQKMITNNAKPVISQTAVCPQKSVHFLPSKAEENKSKPIGTEKDLSFPIELQPEVLHSKMTLLVDPIDVKGRKFRRLQLLSRYMNKWMDAVIFMKTLNSEAQAARRILDISTFYQTWTRQFRHRENQLKSADLFHNTRLLFSHLDQWRKLTVSKTIQRKSLALRNAYRKTKATRERNLCRRVLIIWANYMKSSKFYGSSTQQLVHHSLSRWHQKLQYLSHLSSVSNRLWFRSNFTQIQRILTQWSNDALLRSKLRSLLDTCDSRIKHQFFLDWKISFIQSRQAKFLYLKSRFHILLKACKKFGARKRMLEYSESTVKALRSTNTQMHVLRHWIISARGGLFARAVKCRLLRFYWQRWRRRTMHVHIYLPHLQNQFMAQSTLNLAHHSLQHWIQSHRQINENFTRAQQFSKLVIIRQSFLVWKDNHHRIQQLQSDATSFRIKLLRRRVLFVWKRKILKIKVNVWRQQRRLELIRRCFSAWRFMFRKHRQLSIYLYEFNQISVDQQRMNILSHWQIQVSLRSRDVQIAVKFEHQRFLKRIWKVWIRQIYLIKVLEQESDLVIQRRHQNQKLFVLAYWIDRTRAQVSRNWKLDQVWDTRNRSLIRSGWNKWRDRTRDRELEPLEHHFISKKEMDYKKQIWKIWIIRSKAVFLIRKFRYNQLVKCIKIWFNLSKFNQFHSDSSVHRCKKDREIRRKCFEIWSQKSIDLKTNQMISRFKHNLKIRQPMIKRHHDYSSSTTTTTTTTSQTYSSSN
ncbi:hypothetical protein PSHT_13900 [Puccinia striiformis]|uniref:Sfi1 spindle body domain-containing protein n=1 Tax=Puccinia striiformis TaxID=27350 RepID=A0A2S4UMZ8_9BASI|nr:hypothetical protein PSHT_13900 [Puccinia striiformis]